ncbi:MAG TPA: PilZ domain-containing protein [Thermodesulfobacteriota bacterium]|nr:PilZ domain-containing protein [Thermodesulfobacteriota bacterium]
MTDKRGSRRVAFRTIVHYGQNKPLGYVSFSTDLSSGGVGIKTNAIFMSGTKLHLSVVTADKKYEAEGVVAWAKKSPQHLVPVVKNGIGVRFTHADPGLIGLYEEKVKHAHV